MRTGIRLCDIFETMTTKTVSVSKEAGRNGSALLWLMWYVFNYSLKQFDDQMA